MAFAVANQVLEEPVDDVAQAVLEAAAQVFRAWEERLAAALQAQGHDPAAAAGLATLVVAAVESAIVLCRAQRSIAPFDRVAGKLEALVSRV